MNRCKFMFLLVAAGLLLILSITSASAETNPEVEMILENGTDGLNLIGNLTSSSNETGLIAQEIELNLNFLTSMLQMLDLNLNLINGTLSSHVEEFPFLQPTIEGTNEGIKTVDSILVIMNLSSENLSDTNVTLHSLNETMAQINSTLVSPDGMIESANLTMGQSNATTPMIGDMFASVKGMLSLMEQF
ncbi:MAG: hypothetical protein ACP5N0_05165 [Methanosarcina sp.]